MQKGYGTGASPGEAVGKLHWYKREEKEIPRYKPAAPKAEWERFLSAQQEVIAQLGELADRARKEAGEEAALLFKTHQFMAEDTDLEDAVRTAILETPVNAETAVQEAADEFAEMFAQMEDPYFQARAADVKDVAGRLLAVLGGRKKGQVDLSEPVVLAAEDLSPSETMQLDRGKLLGFVTTGGSASGHTAILARTMEIPAIIGIGDFLKPEMEGHLVLIRGENGEVVVDPDPEMVRAVEEKAEAQRRYKEELESLKGLPSVTQDGRSIKIYCNIASPRDVPAVLRNDAEGIGLFRSEFLYLGRDDLPDEETQFEAYKTVLTDMGEKNVIIRTMDIGADKKVEYLGLPKEENPALGVRALRICLNRPELFRTQLRALYRASAFGHLKIMFPMVTSVWEVLEAKKLCDEVKQELKEAGIPFDGNVQVGVMIETPAAVLISDLLAKEVDFFSCGTNDLTQYTLACDRQNKDLGRFFDPHHPAVLRALKLVCENAHRYGREVGVCGELAADMTMTEEFLNMGMDELSVAPGAVLPLRNKVREIS
ncbi:MAG: phosphoenolpyruvate--protein phosphotransferase [Lachnospiraceae bacterium]|nr:phosphoenolpyruvate--protein phosphotransferase [Lachnospiraceae bacterium]